MVATIVRALRVFDWPGHVKPKRSTELARSIAEFEGARSSPVEFSRSQCTAMRSSSNSKVHELRKELVDGARMYPNSV